MRERWGAFRLSDMELILQKMDQGFSEVHRRLDGMDERLDGMERRLDTIEGKLDELKEDHDATREGVNCLLEWADECGYIVKLPLPKI